MTEPDPADDGPDLPVVALVVALSLAFVWLLAVGAGCATAAETPDPPPVVSAAVVPDPPPVHNPPAVNRAAHIPGVWSYQPPFASPAPLLAGAGYSTTPITPANAGHHSTSSAAPAPYRGLIRIGAQGVVGRGGIENCGPLG